MPRASYGKEARYSGYAQPSLKELAYLARAVVYRHGRACLRWLSNTWDQFKREAHIGRRCRGCHEVHTFAYA